MALHTVHINKFWENKAVLLSYHQEGIGGLRQIIYGSPRSIFAEIEQVFPTFAQNLINEHADMIVQDRLLGDYFEESRGLNENEYKYMDCNDVIKFLKKDMEEFGKVVQSSNNNKSIVKQKWYEVTHLFDTLPNGDHLSIEFENSIPLFCKNLFKNELTSIKASEKEFSQFGRLSHLASRTKSDWLKDETTRLFQDFVIRFNEGQS